ncbi:MAG: hypothetical protein V4568_19460 [Pseudomonadota bacterium]
MRSLNLDFVSRPSRWRYLGFTLLMATVALMIFLGQFYAERSTQLETWEAKWHGLQKAQRKSTESSTGRAADWERLQAELKAANRVITRLSLQWDALFQNIETSVNAEVTLLSIEPDTEKRELKITAEAKNLAAMLDYMTRVRSTALFKDAHVISHQIQLQDPQKPVRFVVSAQWTELSQPRADGQ